MLNQCLILKEKAATILFALFKINVEQDLRI